MKKIKKIMSLVLAALCAATVLTACAPKEDYGDRTVLRVGMYNGGWGTEWIDKVIEKFETEYPEYKILVDGDKKYSTSSLLGIIDTGRQDLFIAPLFLYDFVSQDKLMDITDVMTSPLNELIPSSTDTATIQSKMWPELDEFYGGFNGEGKYYSIPFGGGIYSLNYDRDLFDEKKLFIKEGTSADKGNIVWVDESGELSAGQDGVKGTYDDGLPVSYNDFKALLKEMKRQNITPFIWSKQSGYIKNFLYSVMASYEGKENFNLLTDVVGGEYTFQGDNVPTKITPQNAYKLQGMTGKKIALDFAYEIVKDSLNYHEDSGRETCDFLDAQNKYLMSVDMAKTGDSNRVAFLIDGAHWYNEAKDTIKQMEEESEDYKDRRFGIMPFPKFEGTTATKATYYASSFNNQVCIRKRAEQPELAKLFLAYLHTEESLRTCTEYSGMVRPLTYTMPKETLAKMPYYYQSLWDTFSKADVVHHVTNNPYIYNNAWFFEDEWLWTCHTYDGTPLSNPFVDLIDRNKDVSTEDYWNALKYTFNETYWKEKVLNKVDQQQ